MSEHDVSVRVDDCYREIDVTGQISNLQYGLKMTVMHDSLDLKESVKGTRVKISRATINRNIECTLNLSPLTLKTWAIVLGKELARYEHLFGTILSPEEIAEKFKNN